MKMDEWPIRRSKPCLGILLQRALSGQHVEIYSRRLAYECPGLACLSYLAKARLKSSASNWVPSDTPSTPSSWSSKVVRSVKGVKGVKLDFGSSAIRYLGKGRQAIDRLCKPTDGLS